MYKIVKIDDDAFLFLDKSINRSKVISHDLDGMFSIYENEYDYKCASYDDYPEFEKEHIRIDNLFDMLVYLTGGLR